LPQAPSWISGAEVGVPQRGNCTLGKGKEEKGREGTGSRGDIKGRGRAVPYFWKIMLATLIMGFSVMS